MMRIRFNGGVLAVSLLANVALLGGLVWLNRRPQGPEAQPVPVALTVAESAPPFRWSQLESSDYRTYIANLRKVGCPELTIREIVAADVADLFAPQRGPLLAKMSGAGTPAERSQAEAGLRELGRQEAWPSSGNYSACRIRWNPPNRRRSRWRFPRPGAQSPADRRGHNSRHAAGFSRR